MSSSASRWQWRRSLTTVLLGGRDQARTKPYGDRRPPLRRGQRPGVLTEPEPQGGAVTVGCVAASVPLLAVPLLAGAAGEAVDARTLSFLLARSLTETKKVVVVEEEERKKREEKEELHSLMAVPPERRTDHQVRRITDLLLHRGAKRKRKKKLPRTSSNSSSGRARRRLRQWHARLLVSLVMLLCALCSLRLSPGLRCSALWPVWT